MGEQNISHLKPKRSIRKERKRKRVILITLAGAIILLWCFVLKLTVRIEGSPTVNLEYGSRYEELGASVCLSGPYLLKDGIAIPFLKPEYSSNLNTGVLGRYTVSYSASLFGKNAVTQRQVCVVDTVCPEITFSRDWGANHVDVLYGIKATDNYDGDITDKVTCSRTKGWVTYSVMDSSGNPSYIVRELPMDMSEPPEIILEGENPLVVTVGRFFADPGYQAKDSMGVDLTQYVTVEGEVDWLTPGEYCLNYTVSDSSENTTSVARSVIVQAAARPEVRLPEEKTIYLTFDDGPSPYTARLLETLKRYNAKATFFVTNNGDGSVMEEIIRGGHSIGIHTVSHDYAEIYSSPQNYFKDLYDMQEIIYQNTGVMTSLLRFPGGSSNMESIGGSRGIMTILTEAVQDAGFQYFDWNVDSGDASGAEEWETVAQTVIDGVQQKGTAIVLLHDIYSSSVDAVEAILQWGQENGYAFRALTERSPGFHHEVKN